MAKPANCCISGTVACASCAFVALAGTEPRYAAVPEDLLRRAEVDQGFTADASPYLTLRDGKNVCVHDRSNHVNC